MKFYTGIGSRETPIHILNLMTAIAISLCSLGYILRSGGAEGADTAFEAGAGLEKEIYIPWNNFNGRSYNGITVPYKAPYEIEQQANLLVNRIHPAPELLSAGARKLHARNMYQVLGRELNDPSQFTVCYTEPTYRKGGTRTAVILSMENNIPVWNLAIPHVEKTVRALLTWRSTTDDST